MNANTIIARPSTIHGYIVIIGRGKHEQRYYLDLITPSSARRLCAVLNRLRPVVDWDGWEPTIYYLTSQQEANR